MERGKLYASTICYYQKEEKILFIKFNQKYNGIYCAPGGKLEPGETPTECILREFYEETGLKLINPRLKGFAYWQQDNESGIVYIYCSDRAEGDIIDSYEGILEWKGKDEIEEIKQFAMNKILTRYILAPTKYLFEGKFLLNEEYDVLDYDIKWI